MEDYEIKKSLGLIAEQASQWEPPKLKDYMKKVEKITSHKTEGTRMGVRFEVKWEGLCFQTSERAETILSIENGRLALQMYLIRISKCKGNRFKRMIQNQPELVDILREEEGLPVFS